MKVNPNKVIKNAINKIIRQISIIAIYLSLAVIALLYIGPDIELDVGFQTKLALTSGVLALSISILYELWLKNGSIEASGEENYKRLLNIFHEKSNGLHYPTLQEFLDYERGRRYQVEQDRLNRLLEREQSLLEKMEKSPYQRFLDKSRKKLCRRRIRIIAITLDTIKIKLPYEKSEEFDYLRYNSQDVVYKEFSPKDTAKHLVKARSKKYTMTITLSIIGFNFFSIGSGINSNLWQAAIMFTLAALSLFSAVVGGFNVGYKNISVFSTGIYNTANSFLDQAVAYCKRKGLDLYYKGTTEFREVPPLISVVSCNPVEQLDIFAKAAVTVTEIKDK